MEKLSKQKKNVLVRTLNKLIKAGVPERYGPPIKYNLGYGDSSAILVEKTGTTKQPGYIVISLKQTINFVIDPLKVILFAHVPIGADENAAFKKACAEASAYIQKL